MELKWTGQCNPTCNRGLACIELHVDLPCDSASASFTSAVADVVVRFAMVSPEWLKNHLIFASNISDIDCQSPCDLDARLSLAHSMTDWLGLWPCMPVIGGRGLDMCNKPHYSAESALLSSAWEKRLKSDLQVLLKRNLFAHLLNWNLSIWSRSIIPLT